MNSLLQQHEYQKPSVLSEEGGDQLFAVRVFYPIKARSMKSPNQKENSKNVEFFLPIITAEVFFLIFNIKILKM